MLLDVVVTFAGTQTSVLPFLTAQLVGFTLETTSCLPVPSHSLGRRL